MWWNHYKLRQLSLIQIARSFLLQTATCVFIVAILTPPVRDQSLGATELLLAGSDVRESAKKCLVVFTDL